MSATTSHSDTVIRKSDERGEYLEVPLTKGKVACINVEDAATVLQFESWVTRVVKLKGRMLYYAIHNIYDGSKRVQVVQMHRLIMNAQPGQQVDHRNWDGLCNRRFNLRFADRSQNASNKRVEYGASGFRGVIQDKRCAAAGRKSYYALICASGRNIYSAYFEKPEDAAEEYDRMAKLYHGEFAVTNKMLRELAGQPRLR